MSEPAPPYTIARNTSARCTTAPHAIAPSTTAPYTGGCLCGGLRYQAEGPPRYAGHCYCADCRKASGSGFIPFINFPSSAVRFSGESRQFSSPAANGNTAQRNFCPTCGGLVFGGEVGRSEDFNIYAGSLDDPSRFQPTIAIFIRERPDWAAVPPHLTLFEALPT
jgi:hypothetical protein